MITALSKVKTALAKITGLGSNVSTFLATPSSANLAAALTDETGSGLAVFATSPTTSGMTAKNIVSEVLTTGGGTTAYTLTPSVAIGSYVSGQQFTIKMNATNTDASTINVSGLGARSFTKSGATALSPGDLAIDAVYTITYDGTQFQVSGASSSAVGSTSFVYDETPSGTVNSSNVTFTIASTPVAGSLTLYRDGQRLIAGGADYTLSGTTITFVTAPTTGSTLKVDYQSAVSTAGNADTLDGYHASTTPTASNIPVLDSSARLPYPDGWTPAVGSWTYNAPDKINVPSGAASIYQKGDRVKFTQTTVKYFVVTAVADTLLTFAVNTDYTVADAAITLNYYSHQANPMGFPNAFTVSSYQKLSIIGTTATLWGWKWNQGNGNWYTNGTTVTFGLAFVTAPSVSGTCIGQKTGSDPSTISDFTAESTSMFSGEAITTTQFSAAIGNPTFSTAIGATKRIGYSWIAIGTI